MSEQLSEQSTQLPLPQCNSTEQNEQTKVIQKLRRISDLNIQRHKIEDALHKHQSDYDDCILELLELDKLESNIKNDDWLKQSTLVDPSFLTINFIVECLNACDDVTYKYGYTLFKCIKSQHNNDVFDKSLLNPEMDGKYYIVRIDKLKSKKENDMRCLVTIRNFEQTIQYNILIIYESATCIVAFDTKYDDFINCFGKTYNYDELKINSTLSTQISTSCVIKSKDYMNNNFDYTIYQLKKSDDTIVYFCNNGVAWIIPPEYPSDMTFASICRETKTETE